VKRTLWLPALATVAFSFMGWHLAKSHQPVPDVPPPAPPARTPYSQTIAGAGLIEPRSENISVAAIVPGTVAEVLVKEGDVVSAGSVLFRLDDRQRQAEVAVQEANVRQAAAELTRWEHFPRVEDLPPSAARVERAEADLSAKQDLFERTRGLVQQNVLTDQDLIQAEQAMRAAKAAFSQAKTEDLRLRAGAWEQDLEVSRAALERARQLLKQAQVELDRLSVRAPIDGTVLKVDVRPGEYVGTPAGQPLVVMGDVSTLHVRVDIDEQDLPRFRPDLKGTGYVRGDAVTPLSLRFVRVEPLAEPKRSLTNAGNERVDTRVLQVIYAFEERPAVYVGQQIDVFLDNLPAESTGSQPSTETKLDGVAELKPSH
jgi:HlyD family secretion protein